MSVSHHGDGERQMSEALRLFMEQAAGTARRQYPEGRMGAGDDGALAFAVAADRRHGTVVVNFTKPVAWLGMSAADARRMAELLLSKAAELDAVKT